MGFGLNRLPKIIHRVTNFRLISPHSVEENEEKLFSDGVKIINLHPYSHVYTTDFSQNSTSIAQNEKHEE